MKRSLFFFLYLFLLSLLAGYLLSKATLIGRAGMTFFYKQYAFLKTWWQGAAVILMALSLLFLLLGWIQKKQAKQTAMIWNVLLCVAGGVGLYLTYYDFRHTVSHRLLGERFHLGGYLFWIGWISIPLFYLAQKNKESRPHSLAQTTTLS
jgi:intracellular septation protein A